MGCSIAFVRSGSSLAFVALAALLAVGCGSAEPASEAATSALARPNVLLISIDTLRADHLSTYGYGRDTSPSIDALAARGVLFENALSHSPKTATSHMSIMTSLYPEAHGVVQVGFPDTRRLAKQIPTLAALLTRAGYRAGAVTAGGNVSPELGFDRGMETFDLIDPPRLAFARALERMREFSAPAGDGPAAPFFLFLHTFEVHSPYAPSEVVAERYADPGYAGAILSSREALDARAGQAWEARHEIFFDAVDRSDERDLQHLVDLYDASIRETDAHLGRLLEAMAASGLLANTLIVLLSDHGEEFMEHGELLHGQLYRELLHVPLVFVPPDSAGERFAGVRVPSVVRLVDVTPTILTWLDLKPPEWMQGTSLLPLMEGGPATEPLSASSYARGGSRALRLGIWKLIERTDRRGNKTRALYDVSRDPGEEHDLAPDKASVVALLARRLDNLANESRIFLKTRTPGRRVIPDDEARKRLRALGYLASPDADEK